MAQVYYVKIDYRNRFIEFLSMANSYVEVMQQIIEGWEDVEEMYGVAIIPLEDDFIYCADFKDYLTAGRNEVKKLALDNTER